MSYDPQSMDSMFSKIMTRMDQQDAVLSSIKTAVDKTNGRVTALERFRDIVTAKAVVVAGAISTGIGVAFKLLLG